MQDHNAGLAPYFRDMVRRVMNAKKPRKSDYTMVEDYSADSLAWATDDLYGWLEKNKKADGSKYDLDRDGLRIYTTINYKMQKYAEEAVAERIRDLQADFRRDLRSKTHKPFSNDIDEETRDRVMRQARRWSDRYRTLKKEGLTEAQILKTFSRPVKMRVFAYNKKGYADTTMTPDDSIRYYKSILRTAFVAMEPGTGHVKRLRRRSELPLFQVRQCPSGQASGRFDDQTVPLHAGDAGGYDSVRQGREPSADVRPS